MQGIGYSENLLLPLPPLMIESVLWMFSKNLVYIGVDSG